MALELLPCLTRHRKSPSYHPTTKPRHAVYDPAVRDIPPRAPLRGVFTGRISFLRNKPANFRPLGPNSGDSDCGPKATLSVIKILRYVHAAQPSFCTVCTNAVALRSGARQCRVQPGLKYPGRDAKATLNRARLGGLVTGVHVGP